jgi:hypothetical protein
MRACGTRVFWFWGAFLGAACGETSATAEREEPTDTGVSVPDGPGAEAEDVPSGGGSDPVDLGRVQDAATPVDASVPPDAALPPHLAAPLARIYLHDPITDDDMLTEVTLPETSTPDGRLTDDSVAVFNCLKEAGGVSAMPFGNFVVSLCHEVQQARPAEDGHYLHIEPPRRESDGNDSFAELMMYANVTRAHDYFKSTHGMDWLDFPLPALVNVQFKIEPPVALPGFELGPDGWSYFENAAFFPKETWDALTAQFDLPPRDSDTIIFGQARHDFSYDASVILHEYTHAVVGTGRLNGRVFDRQGLDDSPGAMNEAIADYFAASVADFARVGEYGIGSLEPTAVRDLASPRRCPDDLLNEIHADGRIFGSALWAMRTLLGAQAADAVVFQALTQFGQETTFEVAGELLVAETETQLDVERGAQVRALLVEYGVLGCVRAKAWQGFSVFRARDRVPYSVEGRGSVGARVDRVPGFHQWYLDVPAGAAGVTLGWTMQPSGGFIPGAGGGSGDLDLALRFDAPVEVEFAARLGVTADREVDVPEPFRNDLQGQTVWGQRVTLAPSCLPPGGGRVYLMMLNQSDNPATLILMDETVHRETLPADAVPVECP